jgi:hypothetical protein
MKIESALPPGTSGSSKLRAWLVVPVSGTRTGHDCTYFFKYGYLRYLRYLHIVGMKIYRYHHIYNTVPHVSYLPTAGHGLNDKSSSGTYRV